MYSVLRTFVQEANDCNDRAYEMYRKALSAETEEEQRAFTEQMKFYTGKEIGYYGAAVRCSINTIYRVREEYVMKHGFTRVLYIITK